jgi:protein-disulfide isomerase
MHFRPNVHLPILLLSACFAAAGFLSGCGPKAQDSASTASSTSPQTAQVPAPADAPRTQVHDASVLVPPPGARVALVEFEDMECPVCGNVNPSLRAASAQYNIPLIRHDFPLPQHAWSLQAAVNARWFDTKSKQLGDEYRDAVFANQPSIPTPEALVQFTEGFAKAHNLQMPFAVDPQGTLTADVKADFALGQRVGIDHTPTIWVVTSHSKGAPYVEVADRNKLYQDIDQAIADTK